MKAPVTQNDGKVIIIWPPFATFEPVDSRFSTHWLKFHLAVVKIASWTSWNCPQGNPQRLIMNGKTAPLV